VVLLGGVVAAILLTGRMLFAPKPAQSALDFIPPGRTFFVSVRGGKDFADAVAVLRRQKLPFIGFLNRYLFALEYVLDHKLDTRDVSELCGEDVAVQFFPRFLLVTKTRREYNVFFYLDIKNDSESRHSGVSLRSKFIAPLGKTVHYTFFGDWLVASDDPRYLVSVLKHRGRRRFSAGPETLSSGRVFLGWAGLPGRSVAGLSEIPRAFFRMQSGLICGPSLSSLLLFPRNESLTGHVSPSSGLVFFQGLPVGRKGYTVVTGLYETEGYLSYEPAFYIPSGLSPSALHALIADLREKSGRPDLHLAQEIQAGHHVLYDGEILPQLDRKGVLFFLDCPAVARLGVFEPAMNDWLIRAGRIEVRP
jgi:hypothetical protein